MPQYSLTHLADHVLLRDLASLVAQERVTTAALLAHLAEVDTRKLYLPAAYPSMHHYCVGEFGFSEECAFKRLRAARAAREFPALFGAVSEGRLNLTAVVLLAPHLTAGTAGELLAAAAHRSRAEIELLLARRFPRPDLETRLSPISRNCQQNPLDPDPVDATCASSAGRQDSPPPAKLSPLSPQRFALQVTLGEETREKLKYAQELLGHAVPSGDVAQVLDRALQALIEKLEQRRFARRTRAVAGPRRGEGAAPRGPARDPDGKRDARARNGTVQKTPARDPDGKRDARACDGAPQGRYIQASVRRTVWQRDGGQCTFVSERGQRCAARTRLEFDHVEPLARQGDSGAEQLRLRCRGHNQYAAELVFGRGFMEAKVEKSGRGSAPAPARSRAPEETRRPDAAAADPASDVTPWLRALGFRADEAQIGAASCASLGDAPLEARVRHALARLAPASARRTGAFAPPAG